VADPVGIPFGSYRLLSRIARGGMAEVFLARQKGPESFDRLVAVKRILPHLADTPDFVGMFLAEARLAAQLAHANIVHIYECGRVDDHYFIAMEYVDGVHAGQLVKLGASEPLPVELVARIGADACAGLRYAHERTDAAGRELRLVHRDISPANLLVSFDGTVKLVDFGIAKAATCADQTRPGVVKGKFAYMSPEQCLGQSLDGRSDVFSLGLVLWELCAGQVAVARDDPSAALQAIREGKIPRVEDVRADVPAPLVSAIGDALERDARRRLTAGELGRRLEAFLKQAPGLTTAEDLGTWLRAHFSSPRPALTEPGPTVQATLAAPATSAPGPPTSLATGAEHALTEVMGPPPALAAAGGAAAGRRRLGPLVFVAAVAIGGGLWAARTPRPRSTITPPRSTADAAPITASDRGRTAAKLRAEEVPNDREADQGQTAAKLPAEEVPNDREAADAARPAAVAAVPATGPAPATRPARRRGPKTPLPGYLKARTQPWSDVYLGTRKLGTTPLAEVKLPAGRHTLTFKNPDRPTARRQVDIRPGQTTKLDFELP
jgi:serine/threonine-protein kinase